MTSRKRSCLFNIEWTRRAEYREWLTSAGQFQDRARCRLFDKTFDIGNMGISAIVSHGKSNKHMNILKQRIDVAASVRGARAKYHEHLESVKKQKGQEVADASRKRKQEQLAEIVDKRRRLETDTTALEINADKLYEQAENSSKLTLLAKANALRRGAKCKRIEMKKLDDEIAAFKTE